MIGVACKSRWEHAKRSHPIRSPASLLLPQARFRCSGHAAAHAACPAHGKRSAPALLRHEFVHIMIDVACKSRGEHGQRSRALSMATSVLLLQERFRRSELRCRAWLVLRLTFDARLILR